MTAAVVIERCPLCRGAVYGAPVHPCCAWWAGQAPGRPCRACAAARAAARRRLNRRP